MICRFCNSNPAIGHEMTCHSLRQHDFDNGALDQGGKSWFVVVDEDEWHGWNWNKWQRTEYPIGPDGSLELHSLTETKVSLSMTITSTGRGMKSYTRNKKMTLEEAMNLDFIPKSFGKSQGALGKITGFEYSMSIHVRIGGKWVALAHDSKYVQGFEPDSGYHEDEMYWPTAKVQKWKSTPISVAETVTTTLPNLVIVPPTPEQLAAIEAAAAKAAAEKEKLEKQMEKLRINIKKNGPLGPQPNVGSGTFTYVLSNHKSKVTTS